MGSEISNIFMYKGCFLVNVYNSKTSEKITEQSVTVLFKDNVSHQLPATQMSFYSRSFSRSNIHN